jgi:radical SAM protein with 4Fe4S-binding SPASM domain
MSERCLGLPVHFTIEPTNTCNLRCPVCETGAGSLKREKRSMSLDEFKTAIDHLPACANSILFYYMGEPFLNKESHRMIRYAKGKGLYVTTCTNGHFMNSDKLLNSGIDEISFQIAGLTNGSHQIYRVESDLEVVLANIRELLSKRSAAELKKPKVILGFIVMKHNEREINSFLKFARTLGVDEARLIEPCFRTVEQAKRMLPDDEKYRFYDDKALSAGLLRPKVIPCNRCHWIYFSSVILANGDIVPCCRDVQGNHIMGNIFRETLSSVWNNDRYREFRRLIRNNQRKVGICSLCSDFGLPTLYNS